MIFYTTEELYRTLSFSFSRRRAMRSPGVRGTWDWRRRVTRSLEVKLKLTAVLLG